ncbi:hypothetical protein KIW84_052475 [Lathyrus oleraceus]|uniref:Mon2/Sec7/BIG1-like HUS domain-containing protein n=1 Tax=Pisum sativum TaxID=3888 RepID=A0A9D4WQF2_PEA|nr:hypothetical protein KIW84_052475 [Pisum sativum]
MSSEYDNQPQSKNFASKAASGVTITMMDENTTITLTGKEGASYDVHLMTEPYGVPCMVETFHFLCSSLNVIENTELGPRSSTIAFDEDVPLFALTLINSAIELGGPWWLSLIQDELFHNLMQFGEAANPRIENGRKKEKISKFRISSHLFVRERTRCIVDFFVLLVRIGMDAGIGEGMTPEQGVVHCGSTFIDECCLLMAVSTRSQCWI